MKKIMSSSNGGKSSRVVTYKLYLGLNDKDTRLQKYDVLEAYKVANNIVLSQCDGATIWSGQGIYKHEDGAVVVEQTLVIEISGASSRTIGVIVEMLKGAFNQESVLVDRVSSDRSFK